MVVAAADIRALFLLTKERAPYIGLEVPAAHQPAGRGRRLRLRIFGLEESLLGLLHVLVRLTASTMGKCAA